MTDLPVTGPALLDLRWGQTVDEREDGWLARDLYPHTQHQEADGYLHPGIAAAALLGAVENTVGTAGPPGSVAIAFQAPVPLGMDLRAVVDPGDDGPTAVALEVTGRPGIEDDPVRVVARGTVADDRELELPNEGAFRSAAIAPVPEGSEHELYGRCFVCGQDNPQGLQLLPGYQAPDTVVTAFLTSDEMAEDGRVPPTMTAALLSCPTLWACKDPLDAMDAPAALLTTYEVHFLEDVPVNASLRTVGIAGESSDRTLRGSAALVAESGTVHAVANATWQAVDEVPARETGRPDPVSESSPRKGGRPEGRSDEDWGQPLPGRRETAGPRSERAGDHDRRDSMGIPVDRDDPAEPRRSIGGDG